MEAGWPAPFSGRSTPEKDRVPIVQEVGWAPGPIWTGAENLSPTGIRSPDRPGRSESQYRLNQENNRIFTVEVKLTFRHRASSI